MIEDNFSQSPRFTVTSPDSEACLLERCQKMAGKTLGQIASEIAIPVPNDLRQHKGWVGNLLEHYLGADAGNKAEPDFMKLGIEMKTMPLNAQGQPKESTYVCTIPMTQTGEMSWENSWVKRKLSKVLWVPVEAEKTLPLAQRYVGNAWLWQPSLEQEAILKRDWEELMDKVVLGEQSEITAKEGEFLQIRPKAANSRIVAKGVSSNGGVALINPKGFYLRTTFTRQLMILKM
jgi:DNA mismatch repair protein MutH